MKTKLDMRKVAKGLRGKRLGRVKAGGGFFGAMALAPTWFERRLAERMKDPTFAKHFEQERRKLGKKKS